MSALQFALAWLGMLFLAVAFAFTATYLIVVRVDHFFWPRDRRN